MHINKSSISSTVADQAQAVLRGWRDEAEKMEDRRKRRREGGGREVLVVVTHIRDAVNSTDRTRIAGRRRRRASIQRLRGREREEDKSQFNKRGGR